MLQPKKTKFRRQQKGRQKGNAQRGKGGTEYYYNNGKFSSDHIFLESPKKLIYTKNNTSEIGRAHV